MQTITLIEICCWYLLVSTLIAARQQIRYFKARLKLLAQTEALFRVEVYEDQCRRLLPEQPVTTWSEERLQETWERLQALDALRKQLFSGACTGHDGEVRVVDVSQCQQEVVALLQVVQAALEARKGDKHGDF